MVVLQCECGSYVGRAIVCPVHYPIVATREQRRKEASMLGLWPTKQEVRRFGEQYHEQCRSERNYEKNDNCSGRIKVPDLSSWGDK